MATRMAWLDPGAGRMPSTRANCSAAGVVGRGNEVGTQRVHLRQRADHAGVAEVVQVFAPGQGGAGGRLHRDDAVVPLTPQLLPHKGGDQAAPVGAAAGAADDNIRHNAVFVHGRLGLQPDHRLVQQHLVQHAAQHIPVAGGGGGHFHRFRNGAAQGAGGARVLRQDLPSDGCALRGGGGHAGAIGAHDLPAEGLLLVGAFHHRFSDCLRDKEKHTSVPLVGTEVCVTILCGATRLDMAKPYPLSAYVFICRALLTKPPAPSCLLTKQLSACPQKSIPPCCPHRPHTTGGSLYRYTQATYSSSTV